MYAQPLLLSSLGCFLNKLINKEAWGCRGARRGRPWLGKQRCPGFGGPGPGGEGPAETGGIRSFYSPGWWPGWLEHRPRTEGSQGQSLAGAHAQVAD